MSTPTRTALVALALGAILTGSPAAAQDIAEPAAPAAEPAAQEVVATGDPAEGEAADPTVESLLEEARAQDAAAGLTLEPLLEDAQAADAAAAHAIETALVTAEAEEAAEAPQASPSVMQLIAWVNASGDNVGLPFIVIDKITAEVFVFDAEGQFLDASPALLGSARGDHSAPGVGARKLSAIKPRDRTTPAGRFVARYGSATGTQKVLWVDYATAISLHPVVTTNKKEHRLRRLVSSSVKDNRITYGCINVSAAFYQNRVHKLFRGAKGGIVYILPESQALDEVFPRVRLLQAQQGLRAAGP